MVVKDFKTQQTGGRKRASANILWEDAGRGEEEIYFEVDEQHQEAISCNVDAFFLATVIPALYYGEERYVLERKVCPVLYKGMQEALGWIRHWYYQDRPGDLEMKVKTRSKPVKYKEDRNAAWFLSGGIDSYATFFENRSIYTEQHPRYLKDGIVAFGLETKLPEKFEYVLAMAQNIAKRLEVSLIPIYTNIYLIYRKDEYKNGYKLWLYEFQGAVLAALAHILSNRVNSISIPSSMTITCNIPYGTHPLLDQNYSSEGLQVYHDGYRFKRFEKTKIVANNFSPNLSLRVCNQARKYDYNKLNCGECEKCMRTMLAFLVLGKLDEINAFPYDDISKEMMVNHLIITHDYETKFYLDLVAPLKKIGRYDLVKAIEVIIKKYKREKIKLGLKSKLIDVDQEIFNGNLRKIKQKLRKSFH